MGFYNTILFPGEGILFLDNMIRYLYFTNVTEKAGQSSNTGFFFGETDPSGKNNKKKRLNPLLYWI